MSVARQLLSVKSHVIRLSQELEILNRVVLSVLVFVVNVFVRFQAASKMLLHHVTRTDHESAIRRSHFVIAALRGDSVRVFSPGSRCDAVKLQRSQDHWFTATNSDRDLSCGETDVLFTQPMAVFQLRKACFHKTILSFGCVSAVGDAVVVP